MNAIIRRTVTPTVDTLAGTYCRVEKKIATPDPELRGPGGIAVGPYPRLWKAGEPMTIQTDGPIMMGLNGQPVSVELHRGILASIGNPRDR